MLSIRHLARWVFALACAISAFSLISCASSQGSSGSPRVLTSIAVAAPALSITKGSAQQFTATGSFSDGSMQNITTAAPWASSDTSVATIQPNTGLATGVGPGSSHITASLNGIVSPFVTLMVTAPGAAPELVQHV
ncbi:MAG: Ig-like domain-containing protein, partial [Candidatus Acidiferrum sp.]